jgi:hypothetical protein
MGTEQQTAFRRFLGIERVESLASKHRRRSRRLQIGEQSEVAHWELLAPALQCIDRSCRVLIFMSWIE